VEPRTNIKGWELPGKRNSLMIDGLWTRGWGDLRGRWSELDVCGQDGLCSGLQLRLSCVDLESLCSRSFPSAVKVSYPSKARRQSEIGQRHGARDIIPLDASRGSHGQHQHILANGHGVGIQCHKLAGNPAQPRPLNFPDLAPASSLLRPHCLSNDRHYLWCPMAFSNAFCASLCHCRLPKTKSRYSRILIGRQSTSSPFHSSSPRGA